MSVKTTLADDMFEMPRLGLAVITVPHTRQKVWVLEKNLVSPWGFSQ
jgi:hypothetical protein